MNGVKRDCRRGAMTFVLLTRFELVRPVPLGKITSVTRVHDATCQLFRTEPTFTEDISAVGL